MPFEMQKPNIPSWYPTEKFLLKIVEADIEECA